jgi:hypothetical protein
VRRATRTVHRHAFVPEVAQGGRAQTPLARSKGGRSAPALAAAPAIAPTPLGVVGADEPLPVYSDAWPSWVLALLMLLALAEAYVLVHLVRDSVARARTA